MKTNRPFHFAIVLVIASTAQGVDGAEGPHNYLHQKDAWFAGPEAKRIAENVLSYQSDLGGWPKNVDTTAQRYSGSANSLHATFDNGATTDELRFLARIFNATKANRYKEAFLRGLDHILKAQYSTGGWPQSYPPDRQYHRHITFNDNAMVRLMEFLREVAATEPYTFVDGGRRKSALAAFDRGIDCILKCQIRVGDKRTVWCAQHDELDLQPRKGRSYELVSLSGAESVGIVRLLMSLEHPKPEVVEAIEGAIAWFKLSELKGIKLVTKEDPAAPKGRDRIVVEDPSAPPLWARFYNIATNRPIYCDRDGVPKERLADIGYERRNGYAWLGTWPTALLENDYPAWKNRTK